MPRAAAISNFVRRDMLEHSWVVLDQLLGVALEPDHHFLADGDVEIDLDRPFRGGDADAAGTPGDSDPGQQSLSDPLHSFPARTANLSRQVGHTHRTGSLSWG